MDQEQNDSPLVERVKRLDKNPQAVAADIKDVCGRAKFQGFQSHP